MRGEKGIRLKIKVSSVCTHGILSIFSSPPSVQSSPPFFPPVRTLHNIFPAPLSSYTSSVPAPHPHPCLLHSHTQTHRLVSCEIFLFQISVAGHWTDSQMRQEPSHGPTPPHLSSLERPSSGQWSCLTSLTVDALSCPPVHTQSHILMHTHTHTRTHSYTDSPLLFPCSFTATFPWCSSIRELRRGMEERSEGGMQGVATKVSRVMFGSAVGGFSSAVLCLCVCVLEWGCARWTKGICDTPKPKKDTQKRPTAQRHRVINCSFVSSTFFSQKAAIIAWPRSRGTWLWPDKWCASKKQNKKTQFKTTSTKW